MARVFLWAAAEEERLQNVERIERRLIRQTSQPMSVSDKTFRDNFRLSKAEFLELCDELTPYLNTPLRSTAVLPEIKILAALQYLASGSYQRSVGTHFQLGLAQPTVSVCLNDVINALNEVDILKKYIRFPRTPMEQETISQAFMEKFGFPGVLGCVDGTHVAIIRPRENENVYFNRKMYHSLNVLLVCDANMRITYCDASFGGASHDSHVWNNSPVKHFMEQSWQRGRAYWLLGDSGYAQRPWMMTPILNCPPHSPEEYYTTQHIKTRNVVERCFGVLKSRFRCLLAHRVMHYDPVKAAKIFNACAVLHNFINEPSFGIEEDLIRLDQAHQPPRGPQRSDGVDGGRTAVVQRLWRSRR